MRYNGNGVIEAETAGSLMKKEFITIQTTSTVDEAIMHLRETVGEMKNIHYLYIINEFDGLVGALSIRELLSANGSKPVTEVMVKKLSTFTADKDQEKVARIFQDTDLVSIPVVNRQNVILGVVHVEDILDVMQQEATEDIHKMASVTTAPPALEGGLMDATVGLLYRKRIVWLVILVFMNVFSGAGIAHFEDIIEANIALVFFLPLLVDSGGNAGSQSATLVIRAMAIGDVKIRDWFKMFTKEITVAAAMGFTMALAVSVVGVVRGGVDIAIVVALTMALIVVVGSVVGMSLPFIFKKLKLDPATASAPLITSLCDIVGVLIYFGIAAWFLNL
ncbi:magnesium transporter [Pseudogracilibacillus auburnensis]|uniref:Magnesium transporter MgtE n=1 Tax=Pseudogracilibacillus auburnensis TaxID=1494959 RepID=A0A2V3W4E5_9BACI|nr:magnesium transporter [Pseudogracilibacillus auburnensis]PXW88054.1 Mg2+ transporter MgtE [Pseudogracilibacillus auburnensis]